MSRPETLELPVAPEPEFQVLGATGPVAAVPALEFDVHVSEPGGREVYTIALSAQVMIEPARRSYDAETRETAGRAVRAARALGHHHPEPRLGPGGHVVPAFTGSTTFECCACSFDLEVAAAKYFYWLADGEVPMAFNFNGTVHYRGDDGRLQMSLVPWTCSAEFRFPVAIWRELMEHYYPAPAGSPLQRADPAGAPAREGRARRCRRSTPAWRSCSERS